MFHPPARVDLVEKDRFLTKSVLFCLWGTEKMFLCFFVDRVELSEFLMKSFALLTMKSKPTVLMKFSATQKMKLNPPIAAAISYAESVFHIAKQYFTHPQGWI